jgi:leucyl aminopeptidase
MELTTSPGDIRFLDVDVVVTGLHEDDRPPQGLAGLADWYLFGSLTDLILAGRFAGRRGEMALLATGGRIKAPKLLVVGLGPRGEVTPPKFPALAGEVTEGLRGLDAVEFLDDGGGTKGRLEAAKVLIQALSVDKPRPVAERIMIVPADEAEQAVLDRLLG